MSATNRGGERKAYDFYATPPETIRSFLANFDGISSSDRILEPSAGNGQIIKVLRENGYDNRIDAVELRPEERATLEALADNVTIGSFFDYDPDCGYDVIIGNPPYSMALESPLTQGRELKLVPLYRPNTNTKVAPHTGA